MVFAQIKNGVVKNTLVLNDASLLNLFLCDPVTGVPYDSILQIDQIYPRPGIGWTFDQIVFASPEIEDVGSGFIELTATSSTSTNSANYVTLNGITYSGLSAGTYLVQFTGTFSTNVPILSTPGVLISIFANGVQQVASEMSQNNTNANSPFNMSTSIEVTIQDGQTIDVRWKNNGAANTITCTTRVLDIIGIS